MTVTTETPQEVTTAAPAAECPTDENRQGLVGFEPLGSRRVARYIELAGRPTGLVLPEVAKLFHDLRQVSSVTLNDRLRRGELT